MKIVHLCLCSSYNDNWGYQDNMIPKYNRKKGHDVTVITSTFVDSTSKVGYERVKPGTYYLKDGIKVIRVSFKKFLIKNVVEKLRIYEGLLDVLIAEKPDYIFMHGMQFWDMKIVVKYVRKNYECKLVADIHASYDNSAKKFLSKEILHKIIWKRIIRKSLVYISKIFVIAPACKIFAEEMYGISKSKMEYLYLGADTEKIRFDKKREISHSIRKRLDLKDDDFVFITGGKLSKDKNIELLLRSLKRINSNFIKLIIFGAFPNEIKYNLLEKIKDDDRVRYIGWLNAEDVYDYFLASDAGIFLGTKSALWEQAICSGLPLICKKWEGMQYVDVGGNCIFIEDDNENEIIKSIKILINDKQRYSNMKKIAKTKGYETFSYEKISEQALKYYFSN